MFPGGQDPWIRTTGLNKQAISSFQGKSNPRIFIVGDSENFLPLDRILALSSLIHMFFSFMACITVSHCGRSCQCPQRYSSGLPHHSDCVYGIEFNLLAPCTTRNSSQPMTDRS